MVEQEVRVRTDRAGNDLVLLMRIRPYRTVANVVDGVVITFFDITSRKLLEVALKESERRLSAIISQAAAGVAETDLQGHFTLSNPLFCRIAGRTKAELSMLRMEDILHPDDRARNADVLSVISSDGKVVDLDVRFVKPDGQVIWVHKSISPTAAPDGQVNRILAVVVDITDQKLAEAHRELLLHELSHRVKNTLATVQSIARQTAPGAASVEDYRTAFISRLQSLARTQNLLQTSDWHGALLKDVVLSELAPYQTDRKRWVVEGPDVLLTSNAALALGMAVHELATNAAKYGALSDGTGQVSVEWTAVPTSSGRLLKIQWLESGGPVVLASQKKGFGTRLITQGLALQLDGKIKLDFNPVGVSCTIEVNLPRERDHI
jgi:PAS domain S-box-containing protein